MKNFPGHGLNRYITILHAQYINTETPFINISAASGDV